MKIFGANWQTTLTGGIQAVITAIVTGAVTFPSDWHNKQQVVVFALAILGAFFGISFAALAKTKSVTGGTVQQTVSGAVAEPGTQSLVDQTVIASIKSGDTDVTSQQRIAVADVKPLQ